MRPYLYLLLLGASITTAKNALALDNPRKNLPNVAPPPLTWDQHTDQHHMDLSKPASKNDLGPVVPPSKDTSNSDGDGALTISDILPSQRQINIFAQLTRDISSLTSRLESSLPSSNTTLLAPLNSVMQSLPRKPWEDRPDDTSDVAAKWSEDKASENLRRFVLEHVVGVSPWEEGEKNAMQTLWSEENGETKARKIWWERRGGGSSGGEERKVIMPGEIVVDRVVGRVGNGEIWSLKGVINYE